MGCLASKAHAPAGLNKNYLPVLEFLFAYLSLDVLPCARLIASVLAVHRESAEGRYDRDTCVHDS